MNRCGFLCLAICGLLASNPGNTLAGPPKIGAPNPFVQWLSPLNPAGWRLPEWKWPGQAKKSPVLQQKSGGIWSGMTSAVQRGWRTTKRTLDPTGGQSQPQRGRTDGRTQDKQESFWSGLWPQRQEPKQIKTANDFLSQPMPY